MARKSTLFFTALTVSGFFFLVCFIHAFIKCRFDLDVMKRNQEMVKKMELTDLALFTEARYMRHPSQSDLHSAFQDHPVSLEHFPAGSFGRDPSGIKGYYGKPH
jgi:hypothetical protein